MTITTPRNWLTTKIADPRQYLDKALVIVGPRGSGKSIAANLVAQRFQYSSYAKMEPILRFYGSFMEQRDIIIFDEGYAPKDLSIIKNLITSERVVIEPKAGESYTIKNTTGFIFLTSDDKIFKEDDRRFIITNPMEVMAIMSNIPIK